MTSNIVRLGLAAAAVVALAIVGINLLTTGDRVGGPGPSATPSPTPSPTASPVALHDGPLVPGTYVIGPGLKDTWMECGLGVPEQPTPGCSNTMRLMFTVPDGWAGAGGSIWLEEERNFGPAGAGMIFNRGGWLRSDPCVLTEADAAPPDIPVGPTSDEFATALADHPLLDTTTPMDITLAGYSGKSMDLQVPTDIADCPTTYKPWDGNIYAQGLGQRWHLWILDVDGQRVVVQSTDYAGTSAEHRAELQAIVDSVVIEP